jgi:hypothetical protein
LKGATSKTEIRIEHSLLAMTVESVPSQVVMYSLNVVASLSLTFMVKLVIIEPPFAGSDQLILTLLLSITVVGVLGLEGAYAARIDTDGEARLTPAEFRALTMNS